MSRFESPEESPVRACVLCEEEPSEVGHCCVDCAMQAAADDGDIARVYGLAEDYGRSRATVLKVLRIASANKRAA